MKKGYYTDREGKCLGYWELNEKPVDTADYVFIESDEKPEIFKTDEEKRLMRISEIDSELNLIDLKSIRALRSNSIKEIEDFENRAIALRSERKLLTKVN